MMERHTTTATAGVMEGILERVDPDLMRFMHTYALSDSRHAKRYGGDRDVEWCLEGSLGPPDHQKPDPFPPLVLLLVC